MIRGSTKLLTAAMFFSFVLGSLAGLAEAGPYCIPWEVKNLDKVTEAFNKASAAGAENSAPYYHESVRMYLEFAKMECDENHSSSAADAVKMAVTRAREAGWLPAAE